MLEGGVLVTNNSRKPTKISKESTGISSNGELQIATTYSEYSNMLATSLSSIDVEPPNKKTCLKPKQVVYDHDYAISSNERLPDQYKAIQESLSTTKTSVEIATAEKPRLEITEAASSSSKDEAYVKESDLTTALPFDASNGKSTKQTVTCALCEEETSKEDLLGHISRNHGNLTLDEYHTFARSQIVNVQNTSNTVSKPNKSDLKIVKTVTKKKDCPSMNSKPQVISCIPLSASEVHDFESDSSTEDEADIRPRDRVKVNTTVKAEPSQNITEDPDLKVAKALKDYLGLSDEIPFLQRSKEDQAEIGNHLEHILRVLCDSALVPLMISTLKKQDITKIAALSEVAIKEEGEEDNDEVMARVDADLAKFSNGNGVTNSGDDASSSEDEKIISSEESEGEERTEDTPEVSNQDTYKHHSVKRSVGGNKSR